MSRVTQKEKVLLESSKDTDSKEALRRMASPTDGGRRDRPEQRLLLEESFIPHTISGLSKSFKMAGRSRSSLAMTDSVAL